MGSIKKPRVVPAPTKRATEGMRPKGGIPPMPSFVRNQEVVNPLSLPHNRPATKHVKPGPTSPVQRPRKSGGR